MDAGSGVPYLDALGTAKALAAAAKGGAYDLFWFGQKGVGYDESLVGPMFAELMGVPHVGSVVKLELGDGKVTAHREIEGAHEVVECALPAALTAQKGLNEPRYASLKGIMAAKKKPIAEKKLAELGVPEADPAQAKTRWRKLELPPARQAVRLVPADDPAAAGEGARAGCSREEAKVILTMKFLVFIEQRDGKIRKASLEALSLARKLGGGPASP